MIKCKICGAYTLEYKTDINGHPYPHKCPPCWLVWHEENSSIEDAYKSYTYYAENAAEEVAAKYGDEEEWMESILCENDGVTFLVVPESDKDAKPIRVCVTGQPSIDYSTRIVED